MGADPIGQEQMARGVSIVLGTYNRRRYLRQTIAQIRGELAGAAKRRTQ